MRPDHLSHSNVCAGGPLKLRLFTTLRKVYFIYMVSLPRLSRYFTQRRMLMLVAVPGRRASACALLGAHR